MRTGAPEHSMEGYGRLHRAWLIDFTGEKPATVASDLTFAIEPNKSTKANKFEGGKMQNGWLKLATSLMFAAWLILAGPKAEAQYRSTISGTVMDQTGAIVPKATVTMTNTATNTAN